MKILIVEDNPEKLRKIIGHVVEKCQLDRDEDISVATNGIDAKRALRQTAFDLMILDIVIPLRAEDDPEQNTSVELLRDLTERDRLLRPKHIVGLTAYDEVAKEVAPIFDARLWALIHVDQTSDDWLASLEGFIRYVQATGDQSSPPNYQTDLCIITALRNPEAEAVYRLPWEWGALEPLDENSFFRRGRFQSEKRTFSAIIAVAPRMGMVATALLTSKLIEHFRPRFLAMAGICAGIEGKANFGDVILADPSWDYQSGKRTREGKLSKFSLDSHQLPVVSFLKAHAEHLQTDRQLWNDIRSGWPSPPDTELKLLIGPASSGSAVISDAQFVKDIKEQQRKLIGIEMETYGLYAAANYASSPKPSVFSMKSVCDFADSDKSDEYQSYAAYTSANSIKEFFERYMGAIYHLAGTS